jgi:K(+)-stimulated pyrophosphate-energized sodium pump
MDAVLNNIPLVCTLVGILGSVMPLSWPWSLKVRPPAMRRCSRSPAPSRKAPCAYLNRQMKSMGITGIIIFAVIFATMGTKTAVGFAVGADCLFPGWLHRHARFRTG